MRTIVFFIYFILLGGALPSYSFSYDSLKVSTSKKTVEKQHQKFTNETNDFKLLDYTYIDLEEEYSRDEDIKVNNKNNYFIEKFSLLNALYSSHSNHFISNYFDKRYKIFSPSIGKSCPIYIAQQVLRI